MSRLVIECKSVSIAYNSEIVVKDVSFTVESGEFIGLVGPNGAGKSTILKAIAGLITPKSGNITISSKNFFVGYVPQIHTIDPLYPLNVFEIVKMGLINQIGFFRNLNSKEEQKIEAILKILKLEPYKYKLYRELSGGTKQKVLLARALVTDADILIMDEPTSGLDEDSEKEIINHLKILNQQYKKTILMAFHGLSQILPFVHKKIGLEYGQIKFIKKGDG